jgi:hypothetical protein
MSENFDIPLSDAIIGEIARKGRNYPHEGRSMAKEIQRIRAARDALVKAAAAPPPNTHTHTPPPPNTHTHTPPAPSTPGPYSFGLIPFSSWDDVSG